MSDTASEKGLPKMTGAHSQVTLNAVAALPIESVDQLYALDVLEITSALASGSHTLVPTDELAGWTHRVDAYTAMSRDSSEFFSDLFEDITRWLSRGTQTMSAPVSASDVATMIQRLADQAGGVRALARKWDVSAAYVSYLTRGNRAPGPPILKRLGLKKNPPAPTTYSKAKP